MDLKNSIFSLLAIVGLITLGGCAKYKPHSLGKLVTTTTPKAAEQTVSFTSYALSKNECKYYLDRNLIKKGYQPVLLTFNNNSDSYLTFSKDNLSLSCVTIDQAAKAVHTNTALRAAGYGVVGLFIWPFIIPAIVDGIGSSEANHELDADFAHKALRNQIIAPRAIVSGLIFVSNDEFHEDFSCTLVDQETGVRHMLSTSKPELKV
jgi:hypothetical protein